MVTTSQKQATKTVANGYIDTVNEVGLELPLWPNVMSNGVPETTNPVITLSKLSSSFRALFICRSVRVDETFVGAMSIMKTSFSSEELILLFGRGRRGTQVGKKQRVEERETKETRTGAVWTDLADTLDSSW